MQKGFIGFFVGIILSTRLLTGLTFTSYGGLCCFFIAVYGSRLPWLHKVSLQVVIGVLIGHFIESRAFFWFLQWLQCCALWDITSFAGFYRVGQNAA